MKDKVIILVQGDLYGQRLQQQSFKTWSTRTFSSWRRSPFLLQKKIGIAAVHSFTMETFKTNVLIWRMFMLSSMKADRIICRTWRSRRTRTSRKFRAYSISLRNWYWSIFMKFWISIRLTVHLPHGRDQYCLTIKWSSGQKQKYVSTQIPFYAWVRWMKAKMQFLDEKVKLMNSKCPFLTRIAGNRLRCNWIRVEYFSMIFSSLQILQEIQNVCENGTLNLKKSQTGSSLCQCSTTSIGQKKGNDGIYISKSEKVKEYAKRFSQGHWTLLGLGDEKKCSQSDRWWNDWKRQVIQYLRVSVLWVVGFWRRGWQRHFALRCGCFEHRKGTRKPERIRESQEVKLLVSLLVSGISVRETLRTSNHWPRRFSSQGFANLHRSGTGYQLEWTTKLDPTRTTLLVRSFHYAENTLFLWQTRNPEPFAAIPGGTITGPVIWSSDRENYWPIWAWHCNSITPMIRNGHLMLWFPEERVGS